MDAAPQNKTERINLRVKSSAKDIITLAAGFEGKTVSHFILDTALAHAEKTVREHEIMRLNAQDGQAFFDALAKPIRFNEKLVDALNEHDARVTSK